MRQLNVVWYRASRLYNLLSEITMDLRRCAMKGLSVSGGGSEHYISVDADSRVAWFDDGDGEPIHEEMIECVREYDICPF